MSEFRDAMRCVITGDDAQGQSAIIIDGGPSSEIANPNLGGLFEIWEDATSGPLEPSAHEDFGAARPVLGPFHPEPKLRSISASTRLHISLQPVSCRVVRGDKLLH